MVAITAQTMADEIRRQHRLSQNISDLQEQISTAKRITKPSQDPQAWVQVSDIGRSQAQQAAWEVNLTYSSARAKKAESNLSQLNNLFTRANELLITASTGSLDTAGRSAVAAELRGIRATTQELLNEKDYQGTPVFDDGASILIPVARGMNVEAAGTRQSIAEGVNLQGGGTSTLDAILAAAVTAVESNDAAGIATGLSSMEASVDHIILAQSVQGIRSDRIAKIDTTHTDTDLALSERRSRLEDTNLTVAIATLQSQLLTLEAAQSAFARINKQNLFDLLR